MKIDFSKVTFHPTIDGEILVQDRRKDFANLVYQNAKDIQAHALSLKVFNSPEEGEEYSDDEIQILKSFAEMIQPYWLQKGFMDAINNPVKG